MRKRILAFILCIAIVCCSGCKKQTVTITGGEDIKLDSRLENIVELQKSLFIATIDSVQTVDAVFTKYNVDISKYTLYNVTIEHSFDGYTPTGKAKVYVLGTQTEFGSRIEMSKNEKYIFDAEPWVYGDSVVYLLSPFTVSYPKIDISNGITVALSDSQAVSAGTVDTYTDLYNDAVLAVDNRIPQFSDIKNAAVRYADMFYQINEKNSQTDFYSGGEHQFDWIPSDEHIQKTMQKSKQLCDMAALLTTADTLTKEKITQLLK